MDSYPLRLLMVIRGTSAHVKSPYPRWALVSVPAQNVFATLNNCASRATGLEYWCVSAATTSAIVPVGGTATVEHNMQTILADLRATGFGGAIVITNYYSLDYSKGRRDCSE